jgi:hypothetical protein
MTFLFSTINFETVFFNAENDQKQDTLFLIILIFRVSPNPRMMKKWQLKISRNK